MFPSCATIDLLSHVSHRCTILNEAYLFAASSSLVFKASTEVMLTSSPSEAKDILCSSDWTLSFAACIRPEYGFFRLHEGINEILLVEEVNRK